MCKEKRMSILDVLADVVFSKNFFKTEKFVRALDIFARTYVIMWQCLDFCHID